MAEIELEIRKQNFFQFRPPIFDFEFRREEDEVLLAFSAKQEVPKDLRVRLYEMRNQLPRAERRAVLAADQESRKLTDGFKKSNVFVVADGEQSIAELAAPFGFDGDELVLEHFANRLVRAAGKAEKGDVVFIPQLRSLQAIPLGPVLNVEDVAESVPEGGHRHQARFSITEHGYDPLDPEAWVPDSLLTLGPPNRVITNVFDAEQRIVWLPQFAVLTADGAFLEASPTPPEIVAEANYALTSEDPHAFAVLAGKGSRLLSADSSSVAFEASERPLGAYPAVIDEDQEEEA